MNAARVMHRNVHHVVDDFRGRCRDGHMNRHRDVLDVRDGVVVWPWDKRQCREEKTKTHAIFLRMPKPLPVRVANEGKNMIPEPKNVKILCCWEDNHLF